MTVPTGGQISLTLTDFDSTYSFNILYDSSTYPSQVQIATATGIDVSSLGVYERRIPAGTPLTTTAAGQPAYVRFTVTDPFGASDITSADLVIKNSSGGTVVSTTLTDANVVASTAGSKTYEYAWTPTVGRHVHRHCHGARGDRRRNGNKPDPHHDDRLPGPGRGQVGRRRHR